MKTVQKTNEVNVSAKTKRYNAYFSQPQKDLDLIMQSIKIKNEMFNRDLTFELNF